MPWSITRPQCWRSPDFDKSGPILQFMSCWHSSTQDAEGLLNHGCCGVGVVQVRWTGQGITQCMRHWHKSEHLGYYITSPVRGEGWMLMTLWWMTDSGAIGSDDGSQPDWTGRWPRWNCQLRGLRETSPCRRKTCWCSLCILTMSSVEHRVFLEDFFFFFSYFSFDKHL